VRLGLIITDGARRQEGWRRLLGRDPQRLCCPARPMTARRIGAGTRQAVREEVFVAWAAVRDAWQSVVMVAPDHATVAGRAVSGRSNHSSPT